jgi:hypothetical protein
MCGHVKRGGSYGRLWYFLEGSGLLHDRVRLDERLPMGPCCGGRKWVLGSSKATNAACLAIFDPDTNSALCQQPEPSKKYHMRL